MSEPTPEEARLKAEQEKLSRERLEAFGGDPSNAAEFARFQELEAKYAAKQIDFQDLLRGIETHRTDQEDKARRDAAKSSPEKNQQDQQRNSAGVNDRAAEREQARALYEQHVQKDAARGDERAAERAGARQAWEKSLAGETQAKTIEQEQDLQRKRDIDRGGNF